MTSSQELFAQLTPTEMHALHAAFQAAIRECRAVMALNWASPEAIRKYRQMITEFQENDGICRMLEILAILAVLFLWLEPLFRFL